MLENARGSQLVSLPLPTETPTLETTVQLKCDNCKGTGTVPNGPPWEDYDPATCPECDGNGYILRNYLAEAFAIVQDRSILLVEKEHLIAMVKHFRGLVAALYSVPEPGKAA